MTPNDRIVRELRRLDAEERALWAAWRDSVAADSVGNPAWLERLMANFDARCAALGFPGFVRDPVTTHS